MAVEERLARIEEKMVHIIDGMSSLNQSLERLIIPRLKEMEDRIQVIEQQLVKEAAARETLEIRIQSDGRVLRIGIGLALLGTLGGGASILSRLVGIF